MFDFSENGDNMGRQPNAAECPHCRRTMPAFLLARHMKACERLSRELAAQWNAEPDFDTLPTPMPLSNTGLWVGTPALTDTGYRFTLCGGLATLEYVRRHALVCDFHMLDWNGGMAVATLKLSHQATLKDAQDTLVVILTDAYLFTTRTTHQEPADAVWRDFIETLDIEHLGEDEERY